MGLQDTSRKPQVNNQINGVHGFRLQGQKIGQGGQMEESSLERGHHNKMAKKHLTRNKYADIHPHMQHLIYRHTYINVCIYTYIYSRK